MEMSGECQSCKSSLVLRLLLLLAGRGCAFHHRFSWTVIRDHVKSRVDVYVGLDLFAGFIGIGQNARQCGCHSHLPISYPAGP